MREVLCNYTDNIEIIGASENNLKHIDLTIPKGKLWCWQVFPAPAKAHWLLIRLRLRAPDSGRPPIRSTCGIKCPTMSGPK